MIKYKATGFYRPEIKEVEVERETDSSVWISGRRRGKITDFESFFDTWEDAHSHLLKLSRANVDGARRHLEHVNSTHGNIKGMKRPRKEGQS